MISLTRVLSKVRGRPWVLEAYCQMWLSFLCICLLSLPLSLSLFSILSLTVSFFLKAIWVLDSLLQQNYTRKALSSLCRVHRRKNNFYFFEKDTSFLEFPRTFRNILDLLDRGLQKQIGEQDPHLSRPSASFFSQCLPPSLLSSRLRSAPDMSRLRLSSSGSFLSRVQAWARGFTAKEAGKL